MRGFGLLLRCVGPQLRRPDVVVPLWKNRRPNQPDQQSFVNQRRRLLPAYPDLSYLSQQQSPLHLHLEGPPQVLKPGPARPKQPFIHQAVAQGLQLYEQLRLERRTA